jgi:hypothetical protein
VAVQSPLQRHDDIHRIEVRIDALGERARDLLLDEQQALAKLDELQGREAPHGRVRRVRHARAIRRAERRVQQLRSTRELLVGKELDAIMFALERQSRRTRERLDRELDRLAPVEAEWERLRCAFDLLEVAVATPAIEHLAGQWSGMLEIPEFPVREQEGYAKPFPQGALLF